MKQLFWTTTLLLILHLSSSSAQCPWHREVPDLQSSCLCSYNLGRELSVQCDMVTWRKLLSALNDHATLTPIDLLYVNNSTVGALDNDIFVNLEIHNIQLSGCKITSIAENAFQGQELFVKNLNLQDNDLSVIPVQAFKNLKTLQLLDLSHNRITAVPDGAFETLVKLTTLKLSDNNVTLANNALRGLEKSLKNLNLKGTAQKRIPKAIQGMKTLAFLDLSQNSIRELPGPEINHTFEGLESLTALNLERNILQSLDDNAFYGIRKTLSSLSLLNNLLADFPTAAMSVLSELRVLDIGFNLLTELPHNAFRGNPSITLLALDGNPLTTIPFEAFAHLNSTLRGLSLGGRFLHCDCRLSWVVHWIRTKDLQVTSRERNPQFCGSPPRFRDRGFYSILPEELQCKSKPIPPKPVHEPVGIATVVSADLDDLIVPQQSSTSTTTTTELSTTSKATTSTKPSSTSTTTKVTTTTVSTSSSTATTAVTKPKTKATPSWKNTPKPPIVMTAYPVRNKADDSKEVMVKTAYRQDNSVIIQWDSQVVNILGFRVVYRLFGDKSFKQGPPLESSEREFKIKNVPSQECIIVCVVSLEDLNITPENVPFTQCREVRTVSSTSSNMDKITIVASAAICGTIVVAVIVFIAATRRRSKKLHEFHQQKMSLKHRVPVPGLPVNCCNGMAASPGEGMPSLVTLNAFSSGKDWDQVSAYSTQRPRMYPVEQPQSFDDLRSNFSTKGAAKARSVADGQSQNSFSNHSGRYLANDFQNNLLAAARQDLRASRQSLAMLSERVSNRVPSHHGTVNQSVHSSRGSRPRSRTRDGHHHRRPSSRYSTADSTHSLNQYCENSDNWTDHDMDIYMTRGHAARSSGLVPL